VAATIFFLDIGVFLLVDVPDMDKSNACAAPTFQSP
jgi:hypothetical protein